MTSDLADKHLPLRGRSLSTGSSEYGGGSPVSKTPYLPADDNAGLAATPRHLEPLSSHAAASYTGPMAGPALDLAPTVRVAVQALVALCPTRDIGTPAQSAIQAEETSPPAGASELFHLGNRVYKALADPDTPKWDELAANAIVQAAAGLARGATQDDIEVAFIRQALGEAIDPPADDGDAPHPTSRKDLSLLDHIGQLRFKDSARRQILDAALDRAQGGSATPQARRIAHGVLDVIAEMAAEQFARRLYGSAVEDLLAACGEDSGARIGPAFTRLYLLDRAVGSPYQSGPDRWLSSISRLPEQTRHRWICMLAPEGWDPAYALPARRLRAYFATLLPGFTPTDTPPSHAAPTNGPARIPAAASPAAPHGRQVAAGLDRPMPSAPSLSSLTRLDQGSFVSDMFASAAMLRGANSDVPQASQPAPRTSAALRDMPPPIKPMRQGLRAMLRSAILGMASYFRPSVHERARRQIVDAIKTQASGKALDGTQWAALGAAIRDLDGISRNGAGYAGVVENCVSALAPAQCAALHNIIVGWEEMGADATMQRHIAALDAALTKELAIRTIAPAIRDLMAELPSHRRGATLVHVLNRLSRHFKDHARDSVDARLLCESAVQRLRLRPRDTRLALASIGSLALKCNIKDGVDLQLRGSMSVAQANIEAIRLMPALRTVAASLERAAAH
jgi:hypothetical protein